MQVTGNAALTNRIPSIEILGIGEDFIHVEAY